jgi:hypothetical protein
MLHMDWRNLPTFEQVIVNTLALFGLSGTVLALIAFGFFLLSWYQGGRAVVAGTMMAGGMVGHFLSKLSKMKPVRAILFIFGILAVLAAQALTLILCFVGGNYASFLIASFAGDSGRWQGFAEILDHNPSLVLTPQVIHTYFIFDWITTIYLFIAVAVLARSYFQAWRNKLNDDHVAAKTFLLALPAALTCGYAGLVLVFVGAAVLFLLAMNSIEFIFTGRFSNSVPHDMLVGTAVTMVVFAASFMYTMTCHFAITGSRRVVRALRSDPRLFERQ